MLPSLIVLFICTSYKDVKVFHPHRWLDYMRSVLFRRTPSIDKFLPLGKMSGFSSSHVPFSFFLDSRDKCFDSESLILSRFSFFPQGSFGDFRLRYCGDDILVQQQKFMKSCQLSKMLVFRTMGGVHVLRSCVSCLLLRLFVNPYRLEQSKKENSYLTVPDPDLEIRGEGGAVLRTLR